MTAPGLQNAAPRRPLRGHRRWLRAGLAAPALAIVLLAWSASAALAAGALYIVPSHPPAASEAVGFTNHLNDRAKALPPSLDPPVAESPAQIEARIEDLERGVVIERKQRPRRATPTAAGRPEQAAVQVETFVPRAPGERPPLTAAFVAAGALALLGLVLGVRRRQPARPLGS